MCFNCNAIPHIGRTIQKQTFHVFVRRMNIESLWTFYRDKQIQIVYFLFSLESPTITMKSVKDYVVFEKTNLLLDCIAKGYPAPWVAWIWNNQVLQNNTDGPTYLVRRHITMEEAGNYICMAGNSIGLTRFTYQVTVRSK